LMNEELHLGVPQSHVVLQPLLVTKANLDSNMVKQILDLRWFSK
jgi:hypothetical protein